VMLTIQAEAAEQHITPAAAVVADTKKK